MEKELKTSLGDRVKAARIAKNLTQEELAGQVDVSRPLIVKYENNSVSPNAITLSRIAQVLDTDLEYLINGRDVHDNILSLDECFERVHELTEKEKASIRNIFNSLLNAHDLKKTIAASLVGK